MVILIRMRLPSIGREKMGKKRIQLCICSLDGRAVCTRIECDQAGRLMKCRRMLVARIVRILSSVFNVIFVSQLPFGYIPLGLSMSSFGPTLPPVQSRPKIIQT